MDKETDKRVKETLEKQLELLSKQSTNETLTSRAIYELSSAMCQVATILLNC